MLLEGDQSAPQNDDTRTDQSKTDEHGLNDTPMTDDPLIEQMAGIMGCGPNSERSLCNETTKDVTTQRVECERCSKCKRCAKRGSKCYMHVVCSHVLKNKKVRRQAPVRVVQQQSKRQKQQTDVNDMVKDLRRMEKNRARYVLTKKYLKLILRTQLSKTKVQKVVGTKVKRGKLAYREKSTFREIYEKYFAHLPQTSLAAIEDRIFEDINLRGLDSFNHYLITCFQLKTLLKDHKQFEKSVFGTFGITCANTLLQKVTDNLRPHQKTNPRFDNFVLFEYDGVQVDDLINIFLIKMMALVQNKMILDRSSSVAGVIFSLHQTLISTVDEEMLKQNKKSADVMYGVINRERIVLLWKLVALMRVEELPTTMEEMFVRLDSEDEGALIFASSTKIDSGSLELLCNLVYQMIERIIGDYDDLKGYVTRPNAESSISIVKFDNMTRLAYSHTKSGKYQANQSQIFYGLPFGELMKQSFYSMIMMVQLERTAREYGLLVSQVKSKAFKWVFTRDENVNASMTDDSVRELLKTVIEDDTNYDLFEMSLRSGFERRCLESI